MRKGLNILFIAVVAALFVFSAGCTSGTKNPAGAQIKFVDSLDTPMQASLSALQGDVFAEIESLFMNARDCGAYAGENYSNTGTDTDKNTYLKSEMSAKVAGNKNILTVAYIGNDGILKEIVPESEDILSGDSLTYQDSVVLMNKEKVPMLTDLFELKQGGYAAAVYYPVFSKDSYQGFISITFSPETLLSEYALSLKEDTGFEVMALQTDGVILYDPDEKETGTPTFDNPAYNDFPDIVRAAEKIVKEWSGSAEYSYYSTGTDETVKKRLYWTTVSAGNNEWRIMAVMDM
ncbi:hypothetical protein F1737_11105 [Methanoplanus sp. FWC-SCC4]|uniref:CHASE domain-containing protein n=1 Tax=Methanochimaera problematica TaxID=2609417 RepID=A0AA97FE53_9EURY|nr:hypothetical protein [Methanoplanus sp. FWC-SCC4]WOF17187.1 hypothetical protein F1737_11105 [Methanoplanus sp. FWC-SCC4]